MKSFLKKHFRKGLWLLFFVFVAMNLIAFAHAYKFTHFTKTTLVRTKEPKELSFWSKAKILFTGIDNPKPHQLAEPVQAFTVVTIKTPALISCWHMQVAEAKGTVILFHGFVSEKSSLIGRANDFAALGYNTLLVDFLGSGSSDGYATSVGFGEALQVKNCYDYLVKQGEKNIYLFGASMGAAAILKAVNDYDVRPSGILLECPFGSLYKSVCARFKLMGIPCFPMAALLTFWGGVQHGYWAFSHNPSTYAKAINCPTLLLYGDKDDRVSRAEIESISSNLSGYNMLIVYPGVGHDIFTPGNEGTWKVDVSNFLAKSKGV